MSSETDLFNLCIDEGLIPLKWGDKLLNDWRIETPTGDEEALTWWDVERKRMSEMFTVDDSREIRGAMPKEVWLVSFKGWTGKGARQRVGMVFSKKSDAERRHEKYLEWGFEDVQFVRSFVEWTPMPTSAQAPKGQPREAQLELAGDEAETA